MDTSNIPFVLTQLQDAGLTQTEIGDAIGCSQSTVSDMMRGKSSLKRPAYSTVAGLVKLAKKHRVPTSPPRADAQPA